jgi:hypothetical protein
MSVDPPPAMTVKSFLSEGSCGGCMNETGAALFFNDIVSPSERFFLRHYKLYRMQCIYSYHTHRKQAISLSSLTEHLTMKAYWWSGDTAPRIL